MKSEAEQLKEIIHRLQKLGDRMALVLQEMMGTYGWDEDAEKAIDEWEEFE